MRIVTKFRLDNSFKLTLPARAPISCLSSRPGGRGVRAEESPGSTDERRRLTAAGGNPRDSATESKPPERLLVMEHKPGKGERVRQERTASPATAMAGQTPPGARPNRGGTRFRPQGPSGPPPGLVARGGARAPPQRNGRHVPPRGGAIQNPAYRPAGYVSCVVARLRRDVPRISSGCVRGCAARFGPWQGTRREPHGAKRRRG